MTSAPKFAICNELFENWEFARVCDVVARLGYRGVEIAPFTLAASASDVTSVERKQLVDDASAAGVEIIGLHWLLAKTEGLQVTSPTEAVRAKTGAYFADLAQLCADLGGSLLVFGSPAARKIPPGATKEQALGWAADTLRRALPALAETGVKLLIEPLAPTETDFLQTASEGMELVRKLDHPNVALHLDVKAMSSESLPIPDIVRMHRHDMGHFHANDPNLRGPGMGEVRFQPIFEALKDIDYRGWISVEVFDFKPDPVTIARDSIAYMQRTWATA
ncbi:MAG TPA: sugar phosphate isomerase/epimerase family protein [Planctomycetia bacterium]|nr:sugar phosphate isomerase/epimerase family protein [Planctomycetia bacterium]